MSERTTTITQRARFSAPPAAVYRALTDGRRHAAFTEAPATFDARPGGEMTAYGGYIRGTVTELRPGRGFTQSWRTTEFPATAADSVLEIRLGRDGAGTRLTMIHSNVPRSQAASYAAGWKEHYWEPLRLWLKTARRK